MSQLLGHMRRWQDKLEEGNAMFRRPPTPWVHHLGCERAPLRDLLTSDVLSYLAESKTNLRWIANGSPTAAPSQEAASSGASRNGLAPEGVEMV